MFIPCKYPARNTRSLVLSPKKALLRNWEPHWGYKEVSDRKISTINVDWFGWNTDMNCNLVSNTPSNFKAPHLGFDHHCIYINGRHRLLWLIQNGFELLPVFIRKDYIDEATALGLVERHISYGAPVRLPIVSWQDVSPTR